MSTAYEYLRRHADVALGHLERGDVEAAESGFVAALLGFEGGSLTGYNTMALAAAISGGPDAFRGALCDHGLCTQARGFAVVSAAGGLEIAPDDPTPGGLNRALGGGGLARVSIKLSGLVAFVNRSVHVDGRSAARNVVGALMLAAFDARPQIPYAGSVVFAGWDAAAAELRPLSKALTKTVTVTHRNISAILDGRDIDWPPVRVTAVRELAERIRTMPVVATRVIDLDAPRPGGA